MTICLLRDRILAKQLAVQGHISGGLLIPDATDKLLKALVVAVGSGKHIKSGAVLSFAVQAGDQVLISERSGSEVKLDGEDHIILRADDILAILTKINRA